MEKQDCSITDPNNLLNVQCEFCSTIRPENEIYDADVCADGTCGMGACCIAKRCIETCTFKCAKCLKIFERSEVVYVDDNGTERTFMCIECYNADKPHWCECSIPQIKNYDDEVGYLQCRSCKKEYDDCLCRECDAQWKLISDGVLQCSSCGAERQEHPIKIWYGISKEEWEDRYA